MFKLTVLFTFYSTATAQAPSNEMRVRYNEQTITFRRSTLEEYGISNVEDLIEDLKPKLRKFVEKISDKIITLRRGENEVLNSETSISGLYTEALRVEVGKHNI